MVVPLEEIISAGESKSIQEIPQRSGGTTQPESAKQKLSQIMDTHRS